jgi:prepilin-type N-terminal cleavage/methylation domain-containing protein
MATHCQRGRRAAFTLIELLVVISIITILMSLTFPLVRMLRNHAYKSMALNMVSDLGNACDEYKAEDPRKLYPAPPLAGVPNGLKYDPTNPALVLTLLEQYSTLKVDKSNINPDSTDPYFGCLYDKWTRPIFYQLDGGYMSGIAPGPYTLDTHLMNHIADRPVAALGTVASGIAPTWNSQSIEPFVYIWSVGIPTGSGDTADEQPANWPNWIYRSSSQ